MSDRDVSYRHGQAQPGRTASGEDERGCLPATGDHVAAWEAERVWVPDRRWTTEPEIIAGKRCRMKFGKRSVCPRPAVAALARRNGWWCYCEDHLYGRRLNGEAVEILVHPESPSAERGFTR